ncbi:MAG: VOC family protein [Rhodospirillaceae bacterium]|jgi:catechol 2,3-dioxygenase-like lactoylglutathione lyase family enzyme|nr:VOC family protein [Rhodospirillaceae bacterium]MBT4046087.1 VOC family protein [Rhodospirillaceae bacterium]MBT4690030.1 VOC family protein [Rhodospirillaceae bacterium]MBT5081202.1 VOC family protein [Rhodospirillaceae bacterium]MBT5523490.1 VOC family protein [Rhodospirillaceae bacterium]
MNSDSTIPKVLGIHHSAYLCRDAKETRDFYCDVLGMRMRAALAIEKRPGTDVDLRYMHLFFEMADGNFIAFFDLPDTVKPDYFYQKDSMQEYHFAFEVEDRAALDQFKAQLEARGLPVRGPIDHGFVTSIYFHDPNGLQLEFTIREDRHEEILAEEEANSEDILARWTADTAAMKAERLRPTAAE